MADHLRCDQPGRRSAGDQRGGDDDVHVFGLFGKQRHLGLNELFAHDLGVTAFPGAVLVFKIQHQELGIHTFYLFLDLGAGVKGADDCAHGFGGAVCQA